MGAWSFPGLVIAAAMLAACGQPAPTTTPGNQPPSNAATAASKPAPASGVGIRTQIVPMDFTAFRSSWLAKDPKIMGGVAPWMGVGSGSAANSIPAQQNHMTSKGVNISGNDPQLDKDFFAMIAELDPTKRMAVWKTVQQEAFALHSVLGIARVFDQFAVGDKVGEWAGLDYQSGGSNAMVLGLTGVKKR